MSTKLQLLEEKIGQVLARLDEFKTANGTLMTENRRIKTQMAKLEKDFNKLRLDHNDQTAAMKSKLTAMLGRIEELEKIGL